MVEHIRYFVYFINKFMLRESSSLEMVISYLIMIQNQFIFQKTQFVLKNHQYWQI